MLMTWQKEEIALRLFNWAMWWYGGGGGNGGSIYPAYRSYLGGAIRKSSNGFPLLVGEAQDTDTVLRAMNPRLVKPLLEHHLRRGTPAQKGRRCGCSVATYYRRVNEAEAVFYRLVHKAIAKVGDSVVGRLAVLPQKSLAL